MADVDVLDGAPQVAGGYFGRALVVDVTHGTSRTVGLPERVLREHLGGGGVRSRLLLDPAPGRVGAVRPGAGRAPLVSATGGESPARDVGVAGGRASRSEAVRIGLEELVDRLEPERIGRQIREAYERMPQTDEELEGADGAFEEMLEEESW